MKIVNTQRAITPKVGKPDYCSCVLHVVLRCLMFVRSFMKICQVVLKLWSRHENCLHTKGNNSKSRKTSVTVHVFCMSSYGVYHLCEVS